MFKFISTLALSVSLFTMGAEYAYSSHADEPAGDGNKSTIASSDKNEFSFEKYDLIDDRPCALLPTAVVLKFQKDRVFDNAHHFYISINLVSNTAVAEPLTHIGYMSGEVIAGDCPSRYSDGIYEKYGKHVRLAHFDIKEDYQNRGWGQFALKQFFAMFDKLGLPYKLEVSDGNHLARRLFTKFGFAKVEDVEECHFAGVTSLMLKHKKK
jgi:hypothetical protein